MPAPIVHWSFYSSGISLTRRVKLNNYTYEYLIQLPKLTQETCGRELTLKATGYFVTHRRPHVILTSCKY